MDAPNQLSEEAARRLRELKLHPVGNRTLGTDFALGAEGVLAADSLGAPGHRLAQVLAEEFNHNFDAYDTAIDSAYNLHRIGGSQFHHLLDGQHDVWGAFNAVQDVQADDSFAVELGQALEHIARDTAAVSGANPFFSLTPDEFETIAPMAAELGISKPFLADALTVNGPELLGGSAALVGAILMGRSPDPARLSRFSGGCLLSAAASANPVLLPISAAGMAYAILEAEDQRSVFIQSGQGALVSGSALLVGTLVSGPAWLGCAAGLMAAIAVGKALESPEKVFQRVQDLIVPAREIMTCVQPSLRRLSAPNA